MGAAFKNTLNLFYSLVRNTLAGATGYRRVITHVGSRDFDSICAGVAAKIPGQTSIGVALVWNALIDVAKDFLMHDQYRVVADGITFALGIPGSTTSLDGEPEEGPSVMIYPSSELRNVAADVTPIYSADAADEPEVKQEEDFSSHRYGEIIGTGQFRITGNNITASGEDETLTVIAADGTEAVAVVDCEDGYGSSINAHLAAALPPGKGSIVLITHGKRTPDDELHQCVKSVTIIAGDEPPEPVVPAPTIDSAGTQGCETGTIEAPGGVVEVRGSNLETAATIDLLVGEDGAPVEEMELWQTVAATYDTENEALVTSTEIIDGTSYSTGMVRVTTASGSATYPVMYTVH